jgi:hypothetical protein
MEEIKIPSAKEMFEKTNESEAQYNRLLNHILYGIGIEIAKGSYQYRKDNICGYHAQRIAASFVMKGYEVDIDTNISGKGYRIIIEWSRYETKSKD